MKEELEILKWMQSDDYEEDLEKIVSEELNDAYACDKLESEDLSHIHQKILARDISTDHPKKTFFIFLYFN